MLVDDDEAEETATAAARRVPDEEEVDRFRAFLDNVSPEDFGRGSRLRRLALSAVRVVVARDHRERTL